jgi:hypothetical protein
MKAGNEFQPVEQAPVPACGDSVRGSQYQAHRCSPSPQPRIGVRRPRGSVQMSPSSTAVAQAVFGQRSLAAIDHWSSNELNQGDSSPRRPDRKRYSVSRGTPSWRKLSSDALMQGAAEKGCTVSTCTLSTSMSSSLPQQQLPLNSSPLPAIVSIQKVSRVPTKSKEERSALSQAFSKLSTVDNFSRTRRRGGVCRVSSQGSASCSSSSAYDTVKPSGSDELGSSASFLPSTLEILQQIREYRCHQKMYSGSSFTSANLSGSHHSHQDRQSSSGNTLRGVNGLRPDQATRSVSIKPRSGTASMSSSTSSESAASSMMLMGEDSLDDLLLPDDGLSRTIISAGYAISPRGSASSHRWGNYSEIEEFSHPKVAGSGPSALRVTPDSEPGMMRGSTCSNNGSGSNWHQIWSPSPGSTTMMDLSPLRPIRQESRQCSSIDQSAQPNEIETASGAAGTPTSCKPLAVTPSSREIASSSVESPPRRPSRTYDDFDEHTRTDEYHSSNSHISAVVDSPVHRLQQIASCRSPLGSTSRENRLSLLSRGSRSRLSQKHVDVGTESATRTANLPAVPNIPLDHQLGEATSTEILQAATLERNSNMALGGAPSVVKYGSTLSKFLMRKDSPHQEHYDLLVLTDSQDDLISVVTMDEFSPID